MKPYRADLHIHTLLSPCASLEMSPAAVIAVALERGLDIIAVSDHNSTLHCALTASIGAEHGIVVINAAEVTSAEEVHCLVLLPDRYGATLFQEWLEKNSSNVPYDPETFGYQVVLDREENILQEIDHFLPAALTASVDQIAAEAHRLGGLFIPAHIDRPSFSITSQLGFIPEDLYIDAIEVTGKIQGLLYPAIRNSDAHMPEQIGRRYTTFLLDSPSFSEIAMALKGESGRAIISVTP